MSPQPLVFIGQQRSGTTALQHTFETSKSIRNFGEVFQTSNVGLEAESNFFYFKQKHPSPSLVPTLESVREYFGSYIKYLSSLSDRPFYLMDIKYNSWLHFVPAWQGCAEEPFQLRLMKELKVPVVHIVRNDQFLQALSLEYAMETGVWHTYEESDAPHLPLRVNIRRLLRNMRLSRQRTKFFRSAGAGYARWTELSYEESFRGSVPQLDYIRDQLRGLKIPEDFSAEIEMIKTPLSIPSLVSNKDEILEALVGTGFRNLAKASFASV
jgi:LPS sulfotransferase NodH